MSKYRLFATGGLTALCALGIGYLMQMPPRPAALPAPGLMQPEDMAAVPTESDLALPAILGASAPDLETAAVPDMAVTRADITPGLHLAGLTQDALPQPPADPDLPHLGCALTAEARPLPDAMVALTLQAPCAPDQRLTVHHMGMMFTALTDAQGGLSLTVPALSEEALFILALATGEGAVAQTRVPDLAQVDRVVLQWSGDAGFQIHAREFGADYGTAGHVWAGSATRPGPDHGQVMRLGADDTLSPRMAEIYSFPKAGATRSGNVALSIEAEVTAGNCGQDISAQAIELRRDGTLRTRELSLAVPDCDGVGDFLVLNNLLDDLKIAAN